MYKLCTLLLHQLSDCLILFCELALDGLLPVSGEVAKWPMVKKNPSQSMTQVKYFAK